MEKYKIKIDTSTLSDLPEIFMMIGKTISRYPPKMTYAPDKLDFLQGCCTVCRCKYREFFGV